MPPQYCWYVAYGSNLAQERFARYVANARDTSPPTDDAAVELSGAMYFAQRSRLWGGAVSFLSPGGDNIALCRAWRVTVEQFYDIVAQENGRTAPLSFPLGRAGSFHDIGTTWYGRVHTIAAEWVHAGVTGSDAEPLLTFTGITQHPWSTPPSAEYLRIISHGLQTTYGFDHQASAHYLSQCNGIVAPGETADEPTLMKALRGPLVVPECR